MSDEFDNFNVMLIGGHGDREVLCLKNPPDILAMPYVRDNRSDQWEDDRYVLEQMRTPHRHFLFYRHIDLPLHDAIQRVFESYSAPVQMLPVPAMVEALSPFKGRRVLESLFGTEDQRGLLQELEAQSVDWPQILESSLSQISTKALSAIVTFVDCVRDEVRQIIRTRREERRF